MSNRILVLYGSYRSDRMGIRLANFVIDRLRGRGEEVEFIDAKAIGLPMLDRMYKEHPRAQRPRRWRSWPGRSAALTVLSSSPGNTIGAFSPD